MPQSFDRDEFNERRAAGWNDNLGPGFERHHPNGPVTNMPAGHIPGGDGPSLRDICPECNNPMVNGECTNGECIAHQHAQDAYLPPEERQWVHGYDEPNEEHPGDYTRRDFNQAKVAAPIDFKDPGYNPDHFHVCQNCGGEMTLARGDEPCPHCGTRGGEPQRGEFQDFEEGLANDLGMGRSEWSPEQVSPTEPRWGKIVSAEASMPPEGGMAPQHETALPYVPGAVEDQVAEMHPAAQYAYQRAVGQEHMAPQQAMAVAQEKNGEMAKRTQEGQNTEGVQIPVISNSFVSPKTIARVSHLV